MEKKCVFYAMLAGMQNDPPKNSLALFQALKFTTYNAIHLTFGFLAKGNGNRHLYREKYINI